MAQVTAILSLIRLRSLVRMSWLHIRLQVEVALYIVGLKEIRFSWLVRRHCSLNVSYLFRKVGKRYVRV